MTAPSPEALSSLTGVRSGKRSYYRAFRASSERLEGAVRSLDQISLTLVRTAEGPRALLTAVLNAAAEQLGARWVVFALADGALPDARPRRLALDQDGRVRDDAAGLPAAQQVWADRLRHGITGPTGEDDVVAVPMTIDGEPVGGLAAAPGPGTTPEPMDVAVLRILVNQAAVALHSASMHHTRVALQTRAEQLTLEASARARDLEIRSHELNSAQHLLAAAQEREVLDGERRRIARELHDSVTQHVLSAGMMVELCRSETAALGADFEALADRLGEVRDLTRTAVGQLRAAIYALHHHEGGETPLLPRLIEQACVLRSRPDLSVDLRLEGSPLALPAPTEESLARLAGEALFNVSVHSGAARCLVRLSYRTEAVHLTIDDDGSGDPAALRQSLRMAAACPDGHNRGLVNMASRAAELGGTFAIRRSRLGGVRTQVRVPVEV